MTEIKEVREELLDMIVNLVELEVLKDKDMDYSEMLNTFRVINYGLKVRLSFLHMKNDKGLKK